MTRSTLRAVLLLACAALCAGLLASCGEADDPAGAAAASTLQRTSAATSGLESARVKASFELAPDGLIALGGPMSFRAAGPIAAGAEGELPRFELALAAALARRDLRARATSTGKQIYLRIDGRDYEIDFDGLPAHERGKRGLASLGLDPAGWVAAPKELGTETIGGVETTHVSGTIDVKRLLDDVSTLLGGSDGLLGPRLRAKIEGAVKSTKVDLWTGTSDDILRQLVAVVDFAFERGSSPISGLDGGKVTLRLRLDDVNATTVEPTAPKHARALSDLLGDGGLGALLSGLGAGALGQAGGDGGAAFLKCLDASGSTADIAACASKLAP